MLPSGFTTTVAPSALVLSALNTLSTLLVSMSVSLSSTSIRIAVSESVDGRVSNGRGLIVHARDRQGHQGRVRLACESMTVYEKLS